MKCFQMIFWASIVFYFIIVFHQWARNIHISYQPRATETMSSRGRTQRPSYRQSWLSNMSSWFSHYSSLRVSQLPSQHLSKLTINYLLRSSSPHLFRSSLVDVGANSVGAKSLLGAKPSAIMKYVTQYHAKLFIIIYEWLVANWVC